MDMERKKQMGMSVAALFNTHFVSNNKMYTLLTQCSIDSKECSLWFITGKMHLNCLKQT